jgi:hypothetical protein
MEMDVQQQHMKAKCNMHKALYTNSIERKQGPAQPQRNERPQQRN